MKFLATLFACLFTFNVSGQIQDSTFSNNYFWSTTFVDSLTGFVVGDNGAIFKTEDGGCSWNWIDSQMEGRLFSVDFPTSTTGFICGADEDTESSVILKTTDGGSSWSILNTDLSDNDLFTSSFFLNESVGYVCGDYNTIMKTTDGGDSWEMQTAQSVTYNPQYNDIFFTDLETGFAVSGTGSWPSTLAKTNNGGETWEIIEISEAYSLSSVHFIDQFQGFAGGFDNGLAGVLLRTTDGGNNWENITYGSNNWIEDLYFEDFQNGFIILTNGQFLTTSNGGDTWSVEHDLSQAINGADISFTESGDWHIAANALDYSTIPPGHLGLTATSNNCNETVNITEIVNTEILELYPNPTTGKVYINNDEDFKIQDITILDNTGRQIQVILSPSSNQLDLSYLTNGIYVLKIKTDRAIFTKKIIKNGR